MLRLVLAFAGSLCAVGCRAAARSPDDTRVTLLDVDTLISAESGVLSKPADLQIAADGALFLLDYGGPAILELDPATNAVVHRLGRSGAGPGELRVPVGLAVNGDTVITANAGNGRLEVFRRTGEVLPSRAIPPGALNGRIALNGDGGFVLPSNGADSALARLYRADGQAGVGIGVPVVPHDPFFDVVSYRAAALRGEVPNYYRNGVLAVQGADSTVWLAFSTEPLVARFDGNGRLLWRAAIPASELAHALRWYVERNRRDSTGRRVYPLHYFADLKTEDNRLWLLVNGAPTDPTVVLRIGATGAIERSFRIAGVSETWRLAIRPSTRDLLLSSAETAALYRVRVPPADW